MKKNYVKITLDLLMAITFALLMNPRVLNGLPFHEIAGLILGVAILTHIGLNFKWVITTTKKIFDSKLPKKTRFSYLLNILLLISMATIIVTGILISRIVFPGLAIEGNHSIRGLHNLSANITLILVGLHIGVHWQWIMSICKKLFKTKEGTWRKGIFTSVVFALLLLAGGIQWFASTSTSSEGNFNPKMMEQRNPAISSQNDNNNTANNSQGSIQNVPSNSGEMPNGDFRGHKEGKGSGSPFLVIIQYLAIFTAIIIPTYYIEKSLLDRKQKSRASSSEKN